MTSSRPQFRKARMPPENRSFRLPRRIAGRRLKRVPKKRPASAAPFQRPPPPSESRFGRKISMAPATPGDANCACPASLPPLSTAARAHLRGAGAVGRVRSRGLLQPAAGLQVPPRPMGAGVSFLVLQRGAGLRGQSPGGIPGPSAHAQKVYALPSRVPASPRRLQRAPSGEAPRVAVGWEGKSLGASSRRPRLPCCSGLRRGSCPVRPDDLWCPLQLSD